MLAVIVDTLIAHVSPNNETLYETMVCMCMCLYLCACELFEY